MGWTTTDLHRNRKTLEQAKADYVRGLTQYSTGTAELVAYEWHPTTFYAIIRRTFPEAMHRAPVTFLVTSMIEQSPAFFGYKDMTEEMGPYIDSPPSRSFAALIYKHIPHASGFAVEWRRRNGVKFTTEQPPQLAFAL